VPDLHDWITQQIDHTETAARKAAELCGCHPPSPHWTFGDETTDGRILVVDEPHPGTKRKIGRRWNGSYEGMSMAEHVVRHDPAAVLRRCEADRRILTRHRLNPDAYWYEAAACHGCGTFGDCDDPVTDNLNDCPELLDLGHAHGLTDEILATLDRPQRGERPEPSVFRIGPPARSTSSVPPVLRGPNWKA
jgi:hypothetical protein